MRFQPFAVDDINRPVEERSNILLQAYIAPHAYAGFRVYINHDVDIALRCLITASNRAEQRSMKHPAIAEFRLVRA